MIRAGDLDRTITIESSTDTIAASGAATSTWTTIATMRAKLVTISATDLIRNAGGLSERNLIFQTRWRDGTSTANRITYAGSPLKIVSIREIGRRIGLEITCEALQ